LERVQKIDAFRLAAGQDRELTLTNTFRYANSYPTVIALATAAIQLDAMAPRTSPSKPRKRRSSSGRPEDGDGPARTVSPAFSARPRTGHLTQRTVAASPCAPRPAPAAPWTRLPLVVPAAIGANAQVATNLPASSREQNYTHSGHQQLEAPRC
jgi:hypothetical protein